MTFTGTTNKSITIKVDLATGFIEGYPTLQRNLSYMKGMFRDDAAYEALLAKGDVKMYDFYDLGLPRTSAELAVGTSIVYPGKVGDEYFMTKGHFHEVLECTEVYYCLSGHGYMLMESPEGDWEVGEFLPGQAVYVPGRYAHRSINVSPDEPLKTFFVFRGDAGHDYGTIERKGFRKLMVERDGKPAVIDNPKWGNA
ncbi:MAG: glucose-6-phosphate isomerase [Planctomycetota bacterium]|jgi:glucose-6-phosphate isomerase|nr:glucose-6-phosphate isomerase [Planctomycetota bacterium]